MIDISENNYNKDKTKSEKLWASGWMLAKYEQIQLLPETDNEIEEWFSGFTTGTVEAILYEHLNDRLEYLLQGYEGVLSSIQRWRQQGSQTVHSELTH